ncbi:MAG: type VI secretion system lipoprotein TssJ [Chromatiaceae bacterium]|nr:MAG: type VI secretion system lipoprotein TssJ [Chromatiaceae bacterium]
MQHIPPSPQAVVVRRPGLWVCLGLCVLLAGSGGCAKSPPPPPPPVPVPTVPTVPMAQPEPPPPELRAEVVAAPNANRAPTGQGRSLVVRLFELRGDGAFASADYFRLYDDEAATLGGELIAREELTMLPGQRRLLARRLNPEARYLGVIGAFTDIDRANWRALVALTPGQDNRIQVDVGANSIAATTR